MQGGSAGAAAALATALIVVLGTQAAGAAGDCRASDAQRVYALYSAWDAAHQRQGDETRMRITLRFAKGLSVVPVLAGGSATLDLRSGSVDVEIYGLHEEAEVWLIHNQPGVGASALPDAGDGVQLLGSLTPGPGGAHLSTDLGASFFEGFEVDRIAVCRKGQGPRQGILLLGAPDTFQRLYRRAREGRIERPMQTVMLDLVERGKRLFEEETFAGNGRTCATCHPAANNFTIDPRFIATLPDDDPLFVAEFDPALAELEKPRLMRERGLILENLDGFALPGVMRGVPHTLALGTSVRGPEIPFDNTLNPEFGIVPPAERTGWSGDGAPASGSLREFAIGAVIQHFPRSLAREPGVDFRLPTDDELDALELFQLSLGRSEDLDLSRLAFRSPVVREGLEIFQRIDTEKGTLPAGKCTLCHNQAGANIDSAFFSNVLGAQVSGNANFGTGVNDLAARPEELIDPEGTPQDGGFARIAHDGNNCTPARGGFGTVTPPGGALPPGLCEEDFNTPPLVEAADTGPFFHDNAVDTLEGAVAFYNDDAFNASAGGQLLAALDSGGIAIRLDTSEVAAVASLLRVVNTLENIRESTSLLEGARHASRGVARERLARALEEEGDAVQVLSAVGLHLEAVPFLERAQRATQRARRALFGFSRRHHIGHAVEALAMARERLVAEAPAN